MTRLDEIRERVRDHVGGPVAASDRADLLARIERALDLHDLAWCDTCDRLAPCGTRRALTEDPS